MGTERDFSPDDGQRHLISYDYRIADQTQLLTVPMLLTGLRSAGQVRWNRLVASLSETDRNEWRRLARDARQQFNELLTPIVDEIQRRQRAKIPDYKVCAVRIERAASIPARPGADVALTDRGTIKDPADG